MSRDFTVRRGMGRILLNKEAMSIPVNKKGQEQLCGQMAEHRPINQTLFSSLPNPKQNGLSHADSWDWSLPHASS